MITSLVRRTSATTQRSGMGLVSFLKECRVAWTVGKVEGKQPKVKALPYYMTDEYIAEVRAYADAHDITLPADPTDW
jgi:hypothetical protein